MREKIRPDAGGFDTGSKAEMEENIQYLCQKYTHLDSEEIAYICRIAEALPFMAEQNKADAFINCACGDGNSVIVAHAGPDSRPSLYKDKTVGLFSYPISEPAVDRTLRLGVETRYVRAISQEGSRVIQTVYPVNFKGRTIAVLTYEHKPEEDPVFAVERGSELPSTEMESTAPPALDWKWFLDNALDSAVIMIDMSGFITYRNLRAKELFKAMGYVRDILGQNYRNVHFFRSKELKESGYEEVQIHDKYLRSRIVAVNQAGIAFAVFLNDITSDKETAKELILKSIAVQEMHHRVKNSLQTILSLINLQMRRSESEEVRANMRVISERIQTIATTHQLLAQNVSSGKVSLRGVLNNIANNVVRSQTTACQIRLTAVGDDFEVDSDIATTVAIVVNELLQNAIEHAFPDRKQGSVEIEINRKSASYATITVRDDGIGVRSNEPGNLGSRIVRSMVKDKLRGSIDIEGSDSGTTAKISFPIFE